MANVSKRFETVMGLYSHYRGKNVELKIQRTQMHGKTAKAQAVDLICDVEMAAKRSLYPADYAMFLRLGVTDPSLLPAVVRMVLGKAFKHLDNNGAYQELYAQATQSRRKAEEAEARFSDMLPQEQIDALFATPEVDYLGDTQ
jgi:hypothetical protein